MPNVTDSAANPSLNGRQKWAGNCFGLSGTKNVVFVFPFLIFCETFQNIVDINAVAIRQQLTDAAIAEISPNAVKPIPKTRKEKKTEQSSRSFQCRSGSINASKISFRPSLESKNEAPSAWRAFRAYGLFNAPCIRSAFSISVNGRHIPPHDGHILTFPNLFGHSEQRLASHVPHVYTALTLRCDAQNWRADLTA